LVWPGPLYFFDSLLAGARAVDPLKGSASSVAVTPLDSRRQSILAVPAIDDANREIMFEILEDEVVVPPNQRKVVLRL